jgi:hypothetical protein
MDAEKSPRLKTIRLQALKQTQVKFKRTGAAEEAAEPKKSWQGIQTLKNKVADEAPVEEAEPSILAKMWSNFQELLGNR